LHELDLAYRAHSLKDDLVHALASRFAKETVVQEGEERLDKPFARDEPDVNPFCWVRLLLQNNCNRTRTERTDIDFNDR